MKNFVKKLNHFFSSYMIFFMLVAMLIGWYNNLFFSQYRHLVPWMFGFMTLITSLKTSWKDLKEIFSRPLPLITIVILQHILMPLFAKLLGTAGFPNQPALITGFILAAALPVGITAVIWSGMSEGDVALSLTATTLDTLLSPLTVSLILMLFIGESVQVNYQALMAGLLKMIVIPSIIGLTLHDLTSYEKQQKFLPFIQPFASFCLVGVILVNVATAKISASSMVQAAPVLLLFVLILVASGFILGWVMATFFKFARNIRTSCVYTMGIKNTSCGLVIALGHLPVEASIPLLIAMFFQQPIAALNQKIILRNSDGQN